MSLDEGFVPPVSYNPNADPDAGVFPRFYVQAMPDGKRSQEEGRPIFREVEMIEIRIAGDKTTVIDTKVTDEHRQRWPRHYEAFKACQKTATIGTPVEEWPILTVSRVAELKALNIFTVESLAELSDTGLAKLGMGARELQNKAKAFLESAKSGAVTNQLVADNERMKMEIQMLKDQIRELGSAPAEPRKRPGRPKKSEAA